jgi:hypothetical protein
MAQPVGGILRKRDHFEDWCTDGCVVLQVIKQADGERVGHRQDTDKQQTCEHGMNFPVPYNTVNLISCGTTAFSRMDLFYGVGQFVHTVKC